jgi:hypothetical protein
MAQTNNTTLQLYYSPTAAAVPSAGNLAFGELAINILDEKLYFKNSSGVVKLLASPTGATGTVQSVSVVSANGLAGTVATDTTTPAITLSTTITGILKGNGTAISAAVASTDYAPATSGTSILKGNGTGGFANAVASTDYAPATSGSNILSGNNTGGFTSVTVAAPLTFISGTLSLGAVTTGASILKGDNAGGIENATAGTDYAPATSGAAILKGNNAGGFSNAVVDVDYVAPGANTSITSVALTTGTISTAPSSSTDITNKSYVDAIASGINYHASCQYATTTNLGSVNYSNGASGVGATLTNAGAQAALVIDGHTFTALDVTNGVRVLIKNESNAAYNGIYVITNQGSGSTNWVLTRATDFDTSGLGVNKIASGDLVLITSGTINVNTSWIQQTPLPITVGSTGIVFVQFAAIQTYNAGTGLNLSTNTFSIANIGTAATYGSATQTPVFTTNGQGQVTSVTDTTITPALSSITGFGSGAASALAANVGSAGAFVVDGGALGTPSSGNLANCTFPTLNQNTTGTANNVTGTVAIANGGTGETTRQDAMDALAGSTTSGQYLRGNGTDVVMSAIQVADVPTLNQTTTGNAGGLATTNWTVFQSGTKLFFAYNGVNKVSIDSNGNIITVGNVTAFGTP